MDIFRFCYPRPAVGHHSHIRFLFRTSLLLFFLKLPWQAESVTFTIVQPPRHGTIERTTSGQHFQHTSTFTMEDIYQHRVSYSHDGSNSLKDRFTFTVADGTNPFFIIEEGGKEVRSKNDEREA